MKKKSTKRKKLQPIKTIHNRLYRKASLICREKAGHKCEICASNDQVQAHHICPRSAKAGSPLKWDLRNLIALCNKHHKYGNHAVHKNPIFFYTWMSQHRQDQLAYLLEHMDDVANLKDRAVLQEIESNLK